MTAFTGEIHPYADAYPMLGADDLASLAESIKADGLIHPIVLDGKGRLLDGRNRLAACEMAEVEPTFVVHEGDPVAFVVASNVHRRHLTTGQRAAAVAIGLAEQGKREDGRWAYGNASEDVPDSGLSLKTWKNVMAQAGVVWDIAPDLLGEVLAGTTTLDNAYTKANEKRAADESLRARTNTMRDDAPDLSDLVTEGRMTFDEAWAAYEKRTEEDRKRAAAEAEAIRLANTSITAAIFRLSLLAGHSLAVKDWLSTYDPAVCGHPLDRAVTADAAKALGAILKEIK